MTEITTSIQEPEKKFRLSRIMPILAPLFGGVVGLSLGAVLIVIAGADPLSAYSELLRGALGGKRQITETILRASPLLIMGLGMAVAFRARVWNIGGEGQFAIGALFGAFVGLTFPDFPKPLLLILMVLAGVLGGMLWAFIPGLLKVKRGMSEIITTLMLNYIALLIIEYLARGPMQDPDSYLPESAKLIKAARLPTLFDTRIHIGVVIGVLLVPVILFLLWNTPLGFRLRAVGSRQSVAKYAGINVNRTVLFAITFSGALCGLAGLIEVSTYHYRLKGSISSGYGFTAILVALLGRMHPVGVMFAAVFFAMLDVGAQSMHALYGLPITLADAIRAIIVLSVLAADSLARRRKN
ncbi:MAG: ABC transporter permease [Anaerolineales bacterium]|nr:ABC transporter permease [Anaerolineales bacterium]